MNDRETPATPESRKSLYDNMGKTIEHFSPLLKEGIILMEMQFKKAKDNSDVVFNAFLTLNNYILYHYCPIKI